MQYFAGANTRNGFYSIFEERFSDIKRLFILKGSSGCGKSTFMRRVAERAKIFGLKYDLIFCSSDVNSLDGIIIPELSVAVADGTSPHLLDVKYPCVKETIVNLGQFWDEKKLLPNREKIIFLTDKKANHYKNAYLCLSAAGELFDIRNELLKKCINRRKAESYVLKFIEKYGGKPNHAKAEKVFASAFTSNGEVTLPIFESVKNHFVINGKAAFVLLDLIDISARETGLDTIVSKNPIDPKITNLIYFKDSGTLISSLESACYDNANVKTVFANRFTDNTLLSAVKGKIKATERLADEILKEAQKELAEAKNTHNSLESIYIPSMDFAALDEFTEKVIRTIFSE